MYIKIIINERVFYIPWERLENNRIRLTWQNLELMQASDFVLDTIRNIVVKNRITGQTFMGSKNVETLFDTYLSIKEENMIQLVI